MGRVLCLFGLHLCERRTSGFVTCWRCVRCRYLKAAWASWK